MIYYLPTITKEQYECLAKLDEDKKSDFTIETKQFGFGDRLSAFLKEQVGEVSSNNAKSGVDFYKLFEMIA
jgi:hypothetical protein